MNSIFIFCFVWIVYGIAGILGIQFVPAKYRGYVWTKDYMRSRGIAFLLLGALWFLFGLAARCFSFDLGSRIGLTFLILLVLGMPSIIYGHRIDRKYRSMLENEGKD